MKKKLVLFPFSTACCQWECLNLITSQPKKANTLLIMGRIEKGQIDLLKKIYDQLLPPKHVIAAGACTLSGGIFRDQENIVCDLDNHIPVTTYIPGCPPRPEEINNALLKIKKEFST